MSKGPAMNLSIVFTLRAPKMILGVSLSGPRTDWGSGGLHISGAG
jgi:hypothetical protein